MDFNVGDNIEVFTTRLYGIKVYARIIRKEESFLYFCFVTTLPDLSKVISNEVYKIEISKLEDPSAFIYHRESKIPFNLYPEDYGHEISYKLQKKISKTIIRKITVKLWLMKYFPKRTFVYVTFKNYGYPERYIRQILDEVKEALSASHFTVDYNESVGSLSIGYLRISIHHDGSPLSIPRKLQRKLLRSNKKLKHRIDN